MLLACLSPVSGLCSTCLEERCYDNGECIIDCVPGYFGEFCDEACPSRCLNKACYLDRFDGTVTCTDGCEPGYCNIQCTEPCPGDCATCDRQCNSCNVTVCPERHYGADCTEICSPRYGKCDRETGQCITCRRGFYGDECGQDCPKCFTRADTIRDTCLSGCDICQSKETCPAGFHGDACEVQCSSGCDKRGCNRATGECSTGCVSGYHGLTCNYTCSEHCLSGRCDRATGECSTGCVSGYHGLTCNYTCSEHCLSWICNRATEECSTGCVSGYHGQTCNYTCSRFCVGGVCNQHDGVCTSGCISGYKPHKDVCEQLSNEGSNKTVVIAVPITLVCLVAVMVTAAVIWRRRRYRRSNTPGTEHGPETVPMLPHEDSQTQALAARTKDEIKNITAGMFRVSAVDIVLKKLKEGQRWITITGNAGDGKTVLGYLVLKEFLKKKVNVFTVDKPEEYDQIAKMNVEKVIMFDDRFGAFLADEQLIKSWLDVIRKLLSFNEHDKIKSSVIFVSRKNVVNESRMYLGKFTDQMFDPNCVVDLSLRKVTEERLNILEYHLHHENVTVKHELKKKVADKDIAHGFPHCCKMYSKLRSNGFNVDIEEFFESPLKFLDMTTKVLYKDNCKDLFQLLVKNDGKFNVYNITDEDKRQELLQVEKEQEGSYITVWKDGICRFAHPSVYESVLNVINDIDPIYCVKYATLSVIRQKMIISDEEDNSRAPCYIIVKPIPATMKALAERFTQEEILKGDYSVFKHRLCKSREFSEALVSSCVTSHEEENGSKQFINQPGKKGDTMMLTAARSGHMAAVQSLLKAGADVDIPDERGKSTLHYMCQFFNSLTDREDTIQSIITEGRGDVNKPDQYGQTPLHCLCQVRSSADDHDDRKLQRVFSCVKFIITEKRVDVNMADIYGQTPLHYLFKCQVLSSEEVKWIITEGRGDVNKPDQYGQTPLHYLFKCQVLSSEEVKWIITEGRGDVNKPDWYGQTPLHYLCQVRSSADGHDDRKLQRVFSCVKFIITEKRVDVNMADKYGQTPLHYLFKCQVLSSEEVKWIITEGRGDVNKCDQYGQTPLHCLCQVMSSADGHDDRKLQRVFSCVKFIITEKRVDVNMADKYGQTPLHYLFKCQVLSSEEVKWIITEGRGDVNKPDQYGQTPLHYLFKCQVLSSEEVKWVITEGRGDVNKPDQYGQTPLHCLCQVRSSADGHDDCKPQRVFSCVKFIITEKRVDVNMADKYGQTPLHYLFKCQVLSSEEVKWVITEGRGDVNKCDQYGQTPLHCLCQVMSSADGHDDRKLQRVLSCVQFIITKGRGDVNISDKYGQTPLHYLFKCQALSSEEIKWIITDAKGDLNRCEQHKSTPLHYLCAYSGLQLDTVDLVINEGKADFNTGDEHGTTPFHYLSGNDNVQYDVVLRIVNTARGDLNKQDDKGITPLHVLCKGSLQVKDVLILINKGDKADSYGNTPLHFLCRRRGISDDEVQQLKKERTMMKQNKLGYTPLDYLNNQDDSLPWSDGMIARSAADLVLCRVKHGDTSTLVLGRAMILNSQKVYSGLQVEDFGRELNNMASGERNTPGQFKRFRGTCSSPLPLPPSPSPLTSPSYWETQSSLRRRKRGMFPLLEMGVKEGESNMDEEYWVSYLPGGVGVSVWDVCRLHPDHLCIRVMRRRQEERWPGHQVGECVTLPLPTSGVEVTFTFGLVLDVGRGRVAFLDVGRGKLLCKLDLEFTQQVFPMFYVHPSNDVSATRMRLVSGREISVTDQKIQLIQQALSD